MSVQEAPPTITETTMELLANHKSLPHCKISTFYAHLQIYDLEVERWAVLASVTGEEDAVAQKIGALECSVLRALPDDQVPEAEESPLPTPHRRDLTRFMGWMQQAHNAANGAVQEHALQLVQQQIAEHPTTKFHLVNSGLLGALIHAMRAFPQRPRLQRKATTILLKLPFVRDTTDTFIFHKDGNPVPNVTNLRLDLSVLYLIQELGGWDYIVEAVEQDRYNVALFDLSGGEMRAYARRLARGQIPESIRKVQQLLRAVSNTSNIQDVVMLHRKTGFLRSAFSNFLDD